VTRRQTTPTDVAPDTLTIEEVARVLRIGRSTAYKLVHEYDDTDGASGLPAKWVGGQRRVPRPLLEEFLGGSITWPIPDAPADDVPTEVAPTEPVALPEPIPLATRRRAIRPKGSQLALGLDS
jgi:excisionase family DNA binding protein